MTDFESRLRWLSERGNPVGAEELVERIEAELAGDPLVVVNQRREGNLMTKTQLPPTTRRPNPPRKLTWVAAVLGAIVATVGLFFAWARGPAPVVGTPPVPITVPVPTPESTAPVSDLETIQAGVGALYSGDAERAVQLFAVDNRTDDQLRQEAAYQAAIDGRVDLNCTDRSAGRFSCTMVYRNALTEVAGDWFGPNGFQVLDDDQVEVIVDDGAITTFAFPEHPAVNLHFGSFLAAEGRLDGYEDCAFGPFTESCAAIQLENLDAWVTWAETLQPPAVVEAALTAWYGGDCVAAHYLGGEIFNNGFADGPTGLCPPAAASSQAIEYESILKAEVSVEACEEVGGAGGDALFGQLVVPAWGPGHSCRVTYSNAMHAAVGKPPALNVRNFHVLMSIAMLNPWYEEDLYPEDPELRESFRRFAEGGELADEYTSEGCATARTPECAHLIMDNLAEWATWHRANT